MIIYNIINNNNNNNNSKRFETKLTLLKMLIEFFKYFFMLISVALLQHGRVFCALHTRSSICTAQSYLICRAFYFSLVTFRFQSTV